MKEGGIVDSLKKARALKKKKTRKWTIILGSIVALSGALWYLMIPYKGGITYGVCKVFLEGYVQYPHSIRISTVNDFGNTVRIWFTRVDSFGEYRLEPLQCYYRVSTEEDKLKYGDVGFVVEKITINRREINQEEVDRFNSSILGIVSSPPDLTLPTPIPDSLKDIQLDFSRFRRPIL